MNFFPVLFADGKGLKIKNPEEIGILQNQMYVAH